MATDARIGSAGSCELTGFSTNTVAVPNQSRCEWFFACGFHGTFLFDGLVPDPDQFLPAQEAHQAFHDERDAAMHRGALEIAITLDVSDDPDYLLGEQLPNGRIRLISRYEQFTDADEAFNALCAQRVAALDRREPVPAFTLSLSQYGRHIASFVHKPGGTP